MTETIEMCARDGCDNPAATVVGLLRTRTVHRTCLACTNDLFVSGKVLVLIPGSKK